MRGTCLITGGARGIGRATALKAAAAGHAVAVNYRERADAAEEVVAHIRASGGRAQAFRGDVARESDIVALFAEAERVLGPITALVNSAGIGLQSACAEFDAARLEELFCVNVVGLMLCCREAVRRMSTVLGGRGGAIVNVSSMASTIGGRSGASAYAASKGAVDVFTKGLAKEVAAQGIRVNAVRPGVTLTDMTAAIRDDPAARAAITATIPIGRAGMAEEIAEVICFLLSDRASFVSGARVDAGGGGFLIGAANR